LPDYRKRDFRGAKKLRRGHGKSGLASTEANLFNKDGLPALTFRTDDRH
jgi:hypothetical protein